MSDWDIEVTATDLKQRYRVGGAIKAQDNHFVADDQSVNGMLRDKAGRVGANAVINVKYQRVRNGNEPPALAASGTAVLADCSCSASPGTYRTPVVAKVADGADHGNRCIECNGNVLDMT